MTTKYNYGHEVPTDVLVKRLEELSEDVVKNRTHRWSMRVPAEVDFDPDLVLAEASRRLKQMAGYLPDNSPLC